MSGRSTTQQLLLFLHEVFASRYQTDEIYLFFLFFYTIYLDISKAFDTVSHSHLLDKLISVDISWFWFKAYLTDRFQHVSTNNHCSQLLPVESGVPEGSILGPLLFIIYINSLPDAVLHSKTLIFADDTKCFRHIKSLSDQQLLQADLNLLSSWSAVSCLSFNPSKSVHISFSSKLPKSYILNNCPINLPASHKDLGVIVSSDLMWHHHHDHILRKAYKTLGIIRRTFSHSNSATTKLKLYFSYQISAHLLFYNLASTSNTRYIKT